MIEPELEGKGDPGKDSTDSPVKMRKRILSVEIPALEKERRTERRLGRILAMQALFAYESQRQLHFLVDIDELCRFTWDRRTTPAAVDFAQKLARGTIEHVDAIDRMIIPYLVDWEFDRLSFSNKSILRLSIYQLLFVEDIPPAVAIDEALDLAKLFSDDKDHKFINALLDNIWKARTNPSQP